MLNYVKNIFLVKVIELYEYFACLFHEDNIYNTMR